jgi:hypothetical protein
MQAPRLVTERLIIENLKLQDYPKNVASIALLEKIGMRKEAHFKQSVWIDGRWEDDVIYAVLIILPPLPCLIISLAIACDKKNSVF